MICYMDIELKEGVEACVEVEFQCVYEGCGVDFDGPAESPEFGIHDVSVIDVRGCGWYADSLDLSDRGWLTTVNRLATELLDDDEAYEFMYDAYERERYE